MTRCSVRIPFRISGDSWRRKSFVPLTARLFGLGLRWSAVGGCTTDIFRMHRSHTLLRRLMFSFDEQNAWRKHSTTLDGWVHGYRANRKRNCLHLPKWLLKMWQCARGVKQPSKRFRLCHETFERDRGRPQSQSELPATEEGPRTARRWTLSAERHAVVVCVEGCGCTCGSVKTIYLLPRLRRKKCNMLLKDELRFQESW